MQHREECTMRAVLMRQEEEMNAARDSANPQEENTEVPCGAEEERENADDQNLEAHT